MNVATWNVLHDGVVASAEGAVPGSVRLTVSIAHLCGQLPTKKDVLIVALNGCRRIEYIPYDGVTVTDLPAVASLGLELLTANREDGGISLECADGGYGGKLILQYESADVSTVEGRCLAPMELESAAKQYWTAWKNKHA